MGIPTSLPPPPPKTPPRTTNGPKTKKNRTYTKREGEFVGKELRDQILEHRDCKDKKSHLAKMSKLQLCDLAKTLGIINENQVRKIMP